ncbi:hypothetical protein ASPTUDRAFT_40105, partial [Aspergillus tubingensis CBS 134.48]
MASWYFIVPFLFAIYCSPEAMSSSQLSQAERFTEVNSDVNPTLTARGLLLVLIRMTTPIWRCM